jgi:hypothetical protein
MRKITVVSAIGICLTVLIIAGLPRSGDAATIYACVGKIDFGLVRIVSGPGQCTPLEIPILWNSVGPMGPIGPAGPQGAQGLPGSAGPAGSIGPTGSAGPAGAPGPAGSAGSTGVAGPTGPAGPQGPAGTSSTAGHSCPAGQSLIGFDSVGQIICGVI